MELSKEQLLAQKVIAEAWINPDFKQRLIADPIPTIEAFSGETITLPEGVDRMVVVDQTDPTSTFFNIPSIPRMDDVELTEEQLDAVSGGVDGGQQPPPPPFPPPSGYTI